MSKVSLKVDGILVLTAIGVVAVGSLGLFIFSKREEIKEAAQKVNPASEKNFINQGVNTLVQKITGDKRDTLGGVIADFFSNDEEFRKPTPLKKARQNRISEIVG